MTTPKKIAACDCETDPFLATEKPEFDLHDYIEITRKGQSSGHYGRIPKPFVWGYYDGKDFETFTSTEEFVTFVKPKRIILYAHNGGKFDFMFLLPFLGQTKVQIIGGRLVSLFLGECELRDSFAAVPEALAKFGGKLEIDYTKLEKHKRQANWSEIIDYLYMDCKVLYDGMTAYRSVAGKMKTIASNALSDARKLGIDPGKTDHRFDAKFRRFYYGGRTENFLPGTHRNIQILDIHSAYPFAMSHYHATGGDFIPCDDFNGMGEEEIQRSFITLECFSHGAFPKRISGPGGGLTFPDEYDRYTVTGWEYLVAKKHGLIDNETIVSVHWTDKKITFKPYVDKWYAFKQAHPKKYDPMNYTIGKIMMNSLYGKLAQNPARYYDYEIMPAGTPVDRNNGWTLGPEFEGHEIHRRESLWKWKFEYGAQWEGKKIYNNVATGASVTGFCRAHLLDAMCTIGRHNVIYCDTDSIICKEGTDISAIPQTDILGDWELEDSAAPIGHFAGKKLYAIHGSDGKDKIASKGSKLAFKDLEDIISGKTVTWISQAPTFSIDGGAKFVIRNISATGKTIPSPNLEKT